jgi:hypothetical protein
MKEPVPRVREFIKTCNNFYLAHGAKEWERGRVPNKPSDEGFRANSPAALVWLGYMLARALDLQERWKVAEMLDCDASNVQPRD